MQKIGTKSFDIIYFMNSFSLKRDFLYFDKIYYMEETMVKSARVGNILSKAVRGKDDNLHEWKMHEIAELKEKGVLIPFKPKQITSVEECQAYQQTVDLTENLSRMANQERKVVAAWKGLCDGDTTQDHLSLLFKESCKYSDIEAVLLARCVNFHQNGCVPLLSSWNHTIEDPLMNQAKVINAIIEDFPIIVVDTEWEKIEEYKKRPEVKEYFSALRNWLIDLTKSGLDRDEVKERLAYFKSEHAKHAAFHEIKVKNAQLEKKVLGPLGIIENVVKGNFTDIGKSLIDRKKLHLDLAIEKENLKCAEVAYLVKTHNEFDNDKSRLVKGAISTT